MRRSALSKAVPDPTELQWMGRRYTNSRGIRLSKPRRKIIQLYCNIATTPEKKSSKSTGREYHEFRVCEAQRGVDTAPTFYTVRVMKEEIPKLEKGDFVKITGKLKADFYLSREGKPTGTLLVIAFEAAKISKPLTQSVEKVE